jgi:hypothetical protein
VVILKKVQVDIAARRIGNKPRSELAVNPFNHTDLGLYKDFPSGAEEGALCGDPHGGVVNGVER